MANAIKKISVQRGYDVTEYALNCFRWRGRAARLFSVADALGMETVFLSIHSPEYLSAYGMGLSAGSLRTRSRALVIEELNENLTARNS